MRLEATEIYSDAANQAVMRHPGRRFPGVLVQGDTLYSLCRTADLACVAAKPTLNQDDFGHLNGLRNHLWSLLNHYKSVLQEHDIKLPFYEI